jgi:hypothetical protein
LCGRCYVYASDREWTPCGSFSHYFYIVWINLAAIHACGVVFDMNVTPRYVAKYHPTYHAGTDPESSNAPLNSNTHGAHSIVIHDADDVSV